MPPAPRDARSAAAPSRAPWPTPSRPTKPPAQQNAAATDAAQPFVQAPSPPPSARRSCARPASSGQCNSRAAARRDPRGRSHSQSHRQTPQIAIHYRLKSGDHPYWVLSQKRESSQIIDSLQFQLRLSDSVVLGGTSSFSTRLFHIVHCMTIVMVAFITRVDDPEIPPPYNFPSITIMSFRLPAALARLQVIFHQLIIIGTL